jgi:hypothetical protein
LHWIHSRIKFLEDIYRIQEIALQEEYQERDQLMAQLENMKAPFGYIQAYYEEERLLEAGLAVDPE